MNISQWGPALVLEVFYSPFVFVTGFTLMFMAKSIHRGFSLGLLCVELAILWMIALSAHESYGVPIASTLAVAVFSAVIWRRGRKETRPPLA